MKTFFTADLHLGHGKILEYCNRPFLNVAEMDYELIRRWNVVVGQDDRVYHIGDFTLRGVDAFRDYASQLNGWISFLPGSHDRGWINHDGLGDRVKVLPPIAEIEIDKKHIVLCHYAMRVWNRSHYGALHLYGHSHGMLPGLPYSSMDVGVDTKPAYTPYSLDEILDALTPPEADPDLDMLQWA